jgi:predicted RecA/RadA family phage recombinase
MAQTEEALFHNGLQRTAAYTPSSAVAAGQILAFGSGLDRFIAVANCAIAADEAGTVEFAGVYKVKKKSGKAFAFGEQVGWDDGLNQAVDHSDATMDFKLGVCVGDAGATDDYVLTAINQTRGSEGSDSGL